MKKGITFFGAIVAAFGALMYYGAGSTSKLNLSFLSWANQTYAYIAIVIGIIIFLYGLFGRGRQTIVR